MVMQYLGVFFFIKNNFLLDDLQDGDVMSYFVISQYADGVDCSRLVGMRPSVTIQSTIIIIDLMMVL